MRKKMAALCLLLLLPVAFFAKAGVSSESPTPMPTPRYVGVMDQTVTIRAERSLKSEAVGRLFREDKAYILAYEPGWLQVVQGNDEEWAVGFVPRHTVFNVTALAEEAQPYGATPAVYSCVLRRDAALYEAPDNGSASLARLSEGTKLALLEIEDGWGKVIYARQYGYVYLDAVTALTPVYDVETALPGDAIAAFISFFSLSDQGLNPNRIVNIVKACEYISIPLSPGESFSFNGVAGPYRQTRGYLPAPSFYKGQNVPSYGGGACQVSSTLYNTLLPLKGGITVLFRVAHGPSGATYLPHGVDAACGNENIDLQFRNDYPFPIKIEAVARDGVVYVALIKG